MSAMRRSATVVFLAATMTGALLTACGGSDTGKKPVDTKAQTALGESLDKSAEQYVKLVLELGEKDPGYVDSYYGNATWSEEAQLRKRSLAEIQQEGRALIAEIQKLDLGAAEEMVRLRRDYQKQQLESLVARVEMLDGQKLRFDQESRALYGAVAPIHTAAEFQSALDELAQVLPGKGSLPARLDAYRKGFEIPKDKLGVVFETAIAECKRRTAAHVTLPDGEGFYFEFVTDKPWSGYNWYKGRVQSLIQVNTDLPVTIDRAVDLACHEGYPGHHAYNALLEMSLVRSRGWQEFSVYALYSPQSLVAEGTAGYGVDMAFPGDERMVYERDKLYPLAGLDPAKAAGYQRVQDLLKKLSYAGNEAARRYLDGDINAKAAADWLEMYELYTPRERAEQRVKFIDQYRSYVINYNLGYDMVRKYVEKKGGSDPAARWRVFIDILTSPRLPAGLAV
jgi:hypothetical protein